MNIVEELNKARKNKKQLKTRIDGDIITTIQVSKRKDKNKSELSLYLIEDEHYLVLHENKKHPDPEKVKGKVGNIYTEKLSYEDTSILLKGIMDYRDNRLEECYVNTYSYLCGYCISKGFKIHKILNKEEAL